MTRVALVLVVALASVTSAFAAEETPEQYYKITIPQKSPMTCGVLDTLVSSAHFKGSITVDGLLVYGRYTDNPEDETLFDQTEMFYIPSEGVRATLPFFTPPGTPARIIVSNPDDVLTQIVPTAVLDKLNSKSAKAISVRGTFTLDSYEWGVECDRPYYMIRFVSAESPLVATVLDEYLEYLE